MPILAFLHVAIAIFFAVHAVRTGRNSYWLMVLLAFPFLGSVVYFFAEYLPDVRHTRIARQAVSTMRTLVDPGRDVRDARAQFERTPSVDHRFRLAQALLQAGENNEALGHFEQCAAGPYARDATLRMGLAQAQLLCGRAADAVKTLQGLFADEPERRTGTTALCYAQALADAGAADAREAFEMAMQRHAGIETSSAYGLYLVNNGDLVRGRRLLEDVLRQARLGTQHSRDINRAAIDQARAALKALDEAR